MKYLLSVSFICGLLFNFYSPNFRTLSSDDATLIHSFKVDEQEFTVHKIVENENMPKSVQEMLYDEQVLHNKDLWGANAFKTPMHKSFWPENQPKFGLPYYLIPEDDAKFLETIALDADINKQIVETIDGKKHYKMFVHPESYKHYRFLSEHGYKFVNQQSSEFFAAPTSSYRSLVVWSKSGPDPPFIAKVTLDTTIIGSISRVVKEREVLRSLANQRAFDVIGREKLRQSGVDIYEESAGLVFNKKLEGSPDVLGGQLIRELSPELINGDVRWASLSTVMSEVDGEPLIAKMIEDSGMSSKEFIEKYFIDSYMDMFEKFSFEQGFNFEPHSQNLSMEIKNGQPTGVWVHRDFGGFWPDIQQIIKSGGPVEAFIEHANAEDFYFRGSLNNYATSYAFFYKRQVFDFIVKQAKKYDSNFSSREVAALNAKIDKRMKNMISTHRTGVYQAPDMNNYKNMGEMIKENIKFEKTQEMTEIVVDSEKQYIDRFLNIKEVQDELVVYINKFQNKGNLKAYIDAHGLYIVQGDKLAAFALFNRDELEVLRSKSFSLSAFKDNERMFLRVDEGEIPKQIYFKEKTSLTRTCFNALSNFLNIQPN